MVKYIKTLEIFKVSTHNLKESDQILSTLFTSLFSFDVIRKKNHK